MMRSVTVRPPHVRCHRWAWSLVWLGCSTALLAEEAAKLEFFEAKIRPVLVKHCYECHATGAKEIGGELFVDSAAGLRKGGESGPALVLEKPEVSLLIQALRYESVEMPPDGRLPEGVIQDFEKWIKMGAPDPREGKVPVAHKPQIDIEEGRQFWSFQPLRNVPVPKVADKDWPRGSIDEFILSRLEVAGVKPARDADRVTLIRRLYFDLIGLPPTPEQLDAALGNDSPNAIETLVDQLLESPQFGVKWGRHWLDVARYADSNGGDFNATFHNAWRYRDYVVDAMNQDKRFDQFVREQIAGDLLPFQSDEQRAEQLIASGFLMLGTKMLSERDKEKLTMDTVDEQINTVGSVFMGMTLGCARCHDHKFDPIPTEDYYALAGIFRNTRTLEGESQQYVSTWTRTPLPADAEHVASVAAHQTKMKNLSEQLAAAKKELDAAQKQVAQQTARTNTLTVDDADAEVAGAWTHSTYTPNYVGKGYIHDNKTDKGEKSVEFRFQPKTTGSYEVRLSYTVSSGRANNVPITIRHADGVSEVKLDQTRKPPIDNLFAPVGRFRFEGRKSSSVVVSTGGTVGYVIVDAVQLVEVDEQGKPVIHSQPAASEALAAAKAIVEASKKKVTELGEAIKQLEKQQPAPLPEALAAADRTEIGDCRICIRGEHENRGAEIPRGFVQVAVTDDKSEFGDQESGRRQLAEWLASPKHPLTSRVIVNRVWSYLLGEGIVRSLDNFGELGQRPTHPELLDHLATRFVTEHKEGSDVGLGWSIKRLVREIVLCRTYQLASDHDEESWQQDPENRLLWRANRRRLPAESIRDAMLAISGQLDLTPGGSPVEGLGTLVSNNNADAAKYQGKDSAKRSLYLPIIRNELPSILTVFDFADPDLVVGRRAVTNVPAQALLLMNSPMVMDNAKQTAERLLSSPVSDHRQTVVRAYRTVLSRSPSAVEMARSIAFLERDNTSGDTTQADQELNRLSQLIHVLFASTEFRMLN